MEYKAIINNLKIQQFDNSVRFMIYEKLIFTMIWKHDFNSETITFTPYLET